MMFPPSILYMRKARQKQRDILLPIPLFLLWPIVAAVALILAPFAIVNYIIFASPGSRLKVLAIAPGLYTLICGLRGLRIDVRNEKDNICIRFI